MRFKSDFEKTGEYILKIIKERGFNLSEFKSEVKNIFEQVKSLNLELFSKKQDSLKIINPVQLSSSF